MSILCRVLLPTIVPEVMIIPHLLLLVAGRVNGEEDAAYYYEYDSVSINDNTEEYNYNGNYYYDDLVSLEDKVIVEDLAGMEEIEKVYNEGESALLYYPSCVKANGALYDHRSGDDGFYGGYLEPYEFEEYCCPDSIRGWNPKADPHHDSTKTTTTATKCRRRREQADDDVIDDDNAVDAAVYDTMLETEEGEEGTYTSHLEPCEFQFYRAVDRYYDDDTISPYDPSFSVDFCSDANLIVDGYNEKDGSELITIRTEYVYMWKDECVGQFKQCYSIPADEYIYLDYACYHEWTFPQDATHMSVSCINDRQSKIEYIEEHQDEDDVNIRDYWNKRDGVYYDDDDTNDNDNGTNKDEEYSNNSNTNPLFRKPRWDDAMYALLGAFVLWFVTQCWDRHRCYYGSSSSSPSSSSVCSSHATATALKVVDSEDGDPINIGGRQQRVLRLPRCRVMTKGRKLRGTERRRDVDEEEEEGEEMIFYHDDDDYEETSNEMSNLNEDDDNDQDNYNDIDTNVSNKNIRVVQID